MNDLSRMIDRELETKKAMAVRFAELQAKKDSQGSTTLIQEFANAFCHGDPKEAEQELEARVKLLNPIPVPKSTRPKKEVSVNDRHQRVYQQLPAEIRSTLEAVLKSGPTLIRMFKKKGREYTSLVVTLSDGTKKLFRQSTGETSYLEVDRALAASAAHEEATETEVTPKPTKSE